MLVNKDYFDDWMRRIEEWLERIEKNSTPPEPPHITVLPEGERLLDNYDLCMMLHVSKRTLQRYRSSGELPYHMIYNKTFYKDSDVRKFIEKHFSSFRNLQKLKAQQP